MPTTILDGETYEQARHRRFTEEAKVIEKIQQDEIIRMAREAGWQYADGDDGYKPLWRFAALVAAHEREACAVLCDDRAFELFEGTDPWIELIDCAAAIRARGGNGV